MNSKERMKAAMNLKPVDKTPVMCQMSIGHMLIQTGLPPCDFWFDKDTFAKGLVQLREIYNFDGILVSLHGHSPDWRDSIIKIEKIEESELAELKNGDKIVFPFNDLPYYIYKNKIERPQLSDITENSLPKILDYIPVSANLYFHIDQQNKFNILEDLVKNYGNEFSIHGEITSPFDYFLDMLGYEPALMALLDDPDKCKMMLNHFAKLIKQLAVEMCDTGIEAIKVSSPFAGMGFISPANYEEFVLPYEREIIEAVREKKVHIYIHTCGSIGDRLELMFESGMSGIECLDPEPLGNVKLEEAVERISDKGFIKGNIDSVNILLMGTKEKIVEDVTHRLEVGKTHPGFILSTACSIAPAVKRENIQLLRTLADAF